MQYINYILLAFDNTHHAIATKKLLNNLIDFRTVPTLREINVSCGISLRIDNDSNKLFDIINTNTIDKNLFKLYNVVENTKTHSINISLIENLNDIKK